jgi:acyl carrier protein
MSNQNKYVAAFTQTLMVDEKDLTGLKYQDISTWDSVGHMALMATLEETFDLEMDIDDIIEFSSFEIGKKILAKYNIIVE